MRLRGPASTGLPGGQVRVQRPGMCMHSIPGNQLSLQDAAMTAGYKRAGLSPGSKTLSCLRGKEAK